LSSKRRRVGGATRTRRHFEGLVGDQKKREREPVKVGLKKRHDPGTRLKQKRPGSKKQRKKRNISKEESKIAISAARNGRQRGQISAKGSR